VPLCSVAVSGYQATRRGENMQVKTWNNVKRHTSTVRFVILHQGTLLNQNFDARKPDAHCDHAVCTECMLSRI
jgi:hypothetical protein